MADLGPVTWPPTPIKTERLTLRESAAKDRAAFVDLFSSPEVGTYIGGPQPREEVERRIPDVPAQRPGVFVIDLDGTMIGMVTLERRDADRHAHGAAGRVELGYMFLPESWGFGYAAEACAAALDWFTEALPDEPVVLTTQTANEPSIRLAEKLGFTEVARFEEFGAEQWFGALSPRN